MARRNVTFFLGYAPAGAGLTSRRLIVKRMMDAKDRGVQPAASYDQTLGGTTEFVTTQLKENFLWQATLVDTKSSGEVATTQVLNFHTGSLQFPGPRSERTLQVYSMEDLSSSSDSSINSSSSSSSSTSSSSSNAD